MPEKISKKVARKSLKVAIFGQAKQTYVSYICGALGAGKKDIFVMSRKNIAAVRSEAKQLYWEKSREEFTPVAYGACRLEDGTLYIRTEGGGKGAATTVAAIARRYFKGHHKLSLLWTRVVKEDEPIVADTFLSDGADETVDLVSDFELDAALSQADVDFGEAVADSDGDETAVESEGGSEAGDSSDDETDVELEHDDKRKAVSPLDPKLAADIKTQVEGIVKNLLAVSAAIGLKIDGAEADIVAKFFGWLERILAGLPPAEQAAAAANWLSRLQLAISSSTQAMRDSTVVAGKKSSSDDDEDDSAGESEEETTTPDDGKFIPGIDLNDITTETLQEDEIVRALVDKAIDLLGDGGKDYDLTSASNEKARSLVAANKEKLRTADTVGAIRYMFDVFQRSKFATPEGLVNFLKLKPLAAAPTKANSSEIPNWISEWKTDHASAIERVEGVKAAAEKALKDEDESLSVAKLGGSWKYVDDIFVQVDGAEIEAELRAVMNATDDNRGSAIEKARATLQANLGWLSGNNIVELVDSAPFEGADARVGKALGGSLQGLLDKLSLLEAEAA